MWSSIIISLGLPFLGCRGWELHPDAGVITSVALLPPSRAFLALPRVWRDPGFQVVRNHRGPTLLEAPWPERQAAVDVKREIIGKRRSWRLPQSEPRAFPTTTSQEVGRCSCLQSAIRVAVVSAAHTLWVLDSGEGEDGDVETCPPKIVVYSLLGRNKEVLVQTFEGVPGTAISGLAVDRHASDTRAYVGYPSGGGMIVVSLRSRAFWLLRLSSDADIPLLPKIPRFMPTPVWDLALVTSSCRWPRLAVTARHSTDIFDLPLEAMRAPAPEDRKTCGRGGRCRPGEWLPAGVLGLRRIGRKLGPGTLGSAGLLADPLGGLHYFLVGDAAAVCWDPRQGAGVAGNVVQLRDGSLLPFTEAFFLDRSGHVWAARASAPSGVNHSVLLPPARAASAASSAEVHVDAR